MLHANDLLDKKIIEHGGFVPSYTESSVHDTINEIITIVRFTIMHKTQLQIECNLKDLKSLPRLKFDRRRLQQVLLNLLTNAVKFSNKGLT